MCQFDSCANGETCNTNGTTIVCTCAKGFTEIVCDIFQSDFGVHYIRVLCKFPGWSLLRI